MPSPHYELRTAKISYFTRKRPQPSRPKEFVPGIGYILCLLPVECVVVLIHRAIVDLQAETYSLPSRHLAL